MTPTKTVWSASICREKEQKMLGRHNVPGGYCIPVAVARALHLRSAGWIRPVLVPVIVLVGFAFASAQVDSTYRLAAGTRISLKMDIEVSSAVASVGDTFTAAVSKSVVNRDVTVLTVGTVIEGRVTKVTPAGARGRGGELEIVFEKLWVTGETTRPIEGSLVSKLESHSSRTRSGLSVIGTTIIGAVFGAVTRSSSGALIGAGIGAGTGTAVAILRKGKDVRIGKGEEFEIVLRKDAVLPVPDY